MARIQDLRLRRGTAAQWAATNPVMNAGEPGIATDTKVLKIGDGTNAWTALPEISSADMFIQLISTSQTAASQNWYRGDATGGAITLTLPTAPQDGAFVLAENVGSANAITVQRGAAPDTIEGATTLTINPGTYAVLTYRVTDSTWYRRRSTPEAISGTDMRRDGSGRTKLADPLALDDVSTLKYTRSHSDLEFYDRAIDHAAGAVSGQVGGTGQPFIPMGYTTTANDATAYPVWIGTGTAARMTTTANSTPLGVFAQINLPGPVRHMRVRWTINPNTTNAGGTAGTADTGTVGTIAWQPNFNGNGSTPNVLSSGHVSFSATTFTFAVIYDNAGTPTLANLRTYTYQAPLLQDGTTIHSAEVVIDYEAFNDTGGRGIAYVYAPDGTVHRISNNAIGLVPTATTAAFEIYKNQSTQRLAEIVDIGADSRRTDRILRARRDYMAGARGSFGIPAKGTISLQPPDGLIATAAGGAATSGRANFFKFDNGAVPLKLSGMSIQPTTAAVVGTGNITTKAAVYLDDGTGSQPLLTSAGLLGQVSFTPTSAGVMKTSFAATVAIPAYARVWFCMFYYAATAPTTSPVFLNASSMIQYLTSTNNSTVSAKGLCVTGLTDLPVANQTVAVNADTLGGITFGVPA